VDFRPFFGGEAYPRLSITVEAGLLLKGHLVPRLVLQRHPGSVFFFFCFHFRPTLLLDFPLTPKFPPSFVVSFPDFFDLLLGGSLITAPLLFPFNPRRCPTRTISLGCVHTEMGRGDTFSHCPPPLTGFPPLSGGWKLFFLLFIVERWPCFSPRIACHHFFLVVTSGNLVPEIPRFF